MNERKTDYFRQLDICGPKHLDGLHCTLIGCGGIGSPTALALAKMGVPSLDLYDGDTVEAHNLPNQVFKLSQLGHHKTVALKENLLEYADCTVHAYPEHYTGQQLKPGIVLSGVDSMAVRKELFRKLRFNPVVSLYVEARMGAQVCRIYTLDPSDSDRVRWYEENMLYSDAESVPEACTEKAIIYNVFFIAALLANQVKRFVRGETLAPEIMADIANLQLIAGE